MAEAVSKLSSPHGFGVSEEGKFDCSRLMARKGVVDSDKSHAAHLLFTPVPSGGSWYRRSGPAAGAVALEAIDRFMV